MKTQLNKTWVNCSNSNFTQKEIWMANKMLNVINFQGYVNWKYLEIAVRLKLKGLTIPSVGEDAGQQKFSYLASGSVDGTAVLENNLAVSYEVK